jgi:hypothetical protein
MRKKYMFVPIILMASIFIPACTLFADEHASQSITSTSMQAPHVETSFDIGAIFDPNEVQIKYISFVPTVGRNEAITTAKNWLHAGYNIATEKLPSDATVGLYSGPIRQADGRYEGKANEIEAWIVVIKGLPAMGSSGPPPTSGIKAFNIEWQADIALDALRGEILFAGIDGKQIPIQ